MFEFNAPKFPVGTDERDVACRREMMDAMHGIIQNAIQRGWLESELAMALADVAEDHVMALAERKPPRLYVVSNR